MVGGGSRDTPPGRAVAVLPPASEATGLRAAAPLRLGIIGPLVGGHRGYITTIGDKWEGVMRDAGYDVVAVSHARNRYVRLIDIVWTMLRVGRRLDVLWIICYGGLAFVVEDVASWLGARARVPMIINLHGGAMPEFMARFPRWTCRVLRRADRLVTPSDFLARALVPYGFHAQVISNVVDLAAYPYRHRARVRPRLFWMRSFHEIWNPEMAVRVLALVREKYPEATLVMAGQDKGLQPAVERLAEELGVAGALRFPGFLDMEGKRQEAEEADIFLNTNRIDNQPVSVIEACALGLPVVTTSVGGIPDLLSDGETALFVPDDDPEAMARAVVRLVEEPGLASRLSKKGREVARRCAVERLLPLWDAVFETLRNQTARPGQQEEL